MDLSKGFQIEQPEIFVPWGAAETQFESGFAGLDLRRVTHGYFTAHSTSPGGLSHELEFHFHPRGGGVLLDLEFFHSSYPDLGASYQEFQKHLVATFGQPSLTVSGSEYFSSHTRRLPSAEVVHLVQDRFGPEEHVRIRRTTAG